MKTLTFILSLLFTFNAFILKAQNELNDAKGLEIGTKAPLFEAIDGDSMNVVLADIIKKGNTVLFFYRGAWCPYCNRHLSELQEGLSKLYEKGASVIAVTPENPEYIEIMSEKTGATFTIVYDKDYEIAKAYGVNFAPEAKQIKFYNKMLKANLEEAHESSETNLPIPATYIINNEGIITWRHFDPNYKKRASVEDILEHL